MSTTNFDGKDLMKSLPVLENVQNIYFGLWQWQQQQQLHHHYHNIRLYKNIKAVFINWQQDDKPLMSKDTMVDGITEQHKIHAHNARWIVVLAQQLNHLLLERRCIGDVLVHFLIITVVTWININVQASRCDSLYATLTNCSLLQF